MSSENSVALVDEANSNMSVLAVWDAVIDGLLDRFGNADPLVLACIDARMRMQSLIDACSGFVTTESEKTGDPILYLLGRHLDAFLQARALVGGIPPIQSGGVE